MHDDRFFAMLDHALEEACEDPEKNLGKTPEYRVEERDESAAAVPEHSVSPGEQ